MKRTGLITILIIMVFVISGCVTLPNGAEIKACNNDNYCSDAERLAGGCSDCMPDFVAEHLGVSQEEGSNMINVYGCVYDKSEAYTGKVDIDLGVDFGGSGSIVGITRELRAESHTLTGSLSDKYERLNIDFDIETEEAAPYACFNEYFNLDGRNIIDNQVRVFMVANPYETISEKDYSNNKHEETVYVNTYAEACTYVQNVESFYGEEGDTLCVEVSGDEYRFIVQGVDKYNGVKLQFENGDNYIAGIDDVNMYNEMGILITEVEGNQFKMYVVDEEFYSIVEELSMYDIEYIDFEYGEYNEIEYETLQIEYKKDAYAVIGVTGSFSDTKELIESVVSQDEGYYVTELNGQTVYLDDDYGKDYMWHSGEIFVVTGNVNNEADVAELIDYLQAEYPSSVEGEVCPMPFSTADVDMNDAVVVSLDGTDVYFRMMINTVGNIFSNLEINGVETQLSLGDKITFESNNQLYEVMFGTYNQNNGEATFFVEKTVTQSMVEECGYTVGVIEQEPYHVIYTADAIPELYSYTLPSTIPVGESYDGIEILAINLEGQRVTIRADGYINNVGLGEIKVIGERRVFLEQIEANYNGVTEVGYAKIRVVSAEEYVSSDLADFPYQYIDVVSGEFDGLFVTGYYAKGNDVIAMNTLASYVQTKAIKRTFVETGDVDCQGADACEAEGYFTTEVIPIPGSANVLDTEVSNPYAENMIVVGSPCGNSVAAELLGNPADCTSGLSPNQALIKIFDESDGMAKGKVALLIYGYDSIDTRTAVEGFIYYLNKNDISLRDREILITTAIGSTTETVEVDNEPKTSDNQELASLDGSATQTTFTKWLNRDSPSGNGDYEMISHLRESYNFCAEPLEIECRTTTGIDYSEAGEIVVCNLKDGFYCTNANQPDGKCDYDYEVRFLCPA